MKAALRLELVLDTFFYNHKNNLLGWNEFINGTKMLGTDKEPTYVAEINLRGSELNKKVIFPVRDYSEARKNGDRGIFGLYVLDEKNFYYVHDRYDLKKARSYYCTVRDWKIVEVSENEVYKCLKNISE